jgi:hypothetical protein
MNADLLVKLSNDFCYRRIAEFWLENFPDKVEEIQNIQLLWNSFLLRDQDTNKEILKPVIIGGDRFFISDKDRKIYSTDFEEIKVK